MLKYLKQIGDSALGSTEPVALLGALFFIAIALSTQMLGYTKLTWLPFQLLIIGLMHKNFLVSAAERKKAAAASVGHARLPLTAAARLSALYQERANNASTGINS